MKVASNGEFSTVVVTDGGPGLSDEDLARIGDRFWRSARHQNIKGSGLGLSISRALLAAAAWLHRVRPSRAARPAGDGAGAEVAVQLLSRLLCSGGGDGAARA